MTAWFVVGIVVCIINPILGALILWPVCVVWIAKWLSGRDG